MIKFTNSKTFQILKDRWIDKDMEKYFVDKNTAFHTRLKKEYDTKIKRTTGSKTER